MLKKAIDTDVLTKWWDHYLILSFLENTKIDCPTDICWQV